MMTGGSDIWRVTFFDQCTIQYENGFLLFAWSAQKADVVAWEVHQQQDRPEHRWKASKVFQGAWFSEYDDALHFYAGERIMVVYGDGGTKQRVLEEFARKMIKVAPKLKDLPELITGPECGDGEPLVAALLGQSATSTTQR